MFRTKEQALRILRLQASQSGWQWVVTNDIHYACVQFRKDSFPTREEYFVVVPARVEGITKIDNLCYHAYASISGA